MKRIRQCVVKYCENMVEDGQYSCPECRKILNRRQYQKRKQKMKEKKGVNDAIGEKLNQIEQLIGEIQALRMTKRRN